jgi:hypothetical protein
MTKKKKEVCPYCGKSFVYLNRHKCKVKERMEGSEVSDKSESERRIERIEEWKRDFNRNLKKDEKKILDIIKKHKRIYFKDLIEISGKSRNDLDDIIDILSLQSKVKVTRELVDASWTKNISYIEEIDMDVKEIKVDKSDKNFIIEIFSYQPCLICPFSSKCNETNMDNLNPHQCVWLTEWINATMEEKKYVINFNEIEAESVE